MKNIHVLPTNKPSIFYKRNDKNSYHLGDFVVCEKGDKLRTNQNIYITSFNEDIKENDYIITKGGRLVQVSYLMSKDLEGASKVVLTTDPNLIRDDVQAIDDEFLEWFIDNPSCEFANVYRVLWSDYSYSYDIIVTKEEYTGGLEMGQIPEKQENCCTPVGHIRRYKDCIGCDRKPKQETIEEASLNHFLSTSNVIVKDIKDYDFKQETLEEMAKKYIGFPLNKDMDEEQRYYNPNAKTYDAFIKGGERQTEKICNSEFIQRIRATKSDAEARRIIREYLK